MSRKNEPSIKSNSARSLKAENKKDKQSRLSQTACPSVSLEEALLIPRAIKDKYAGQATVPLLVASACNISPASSKWRSITGAAVAYGLTNGAYNAKEISLTPLGERIVAPLIEGDDEIALKEAVLKPSVLADFYHENNGKKLPKPEIAFNILQKKGIPYDRINSVWEILKENAKRTNILKVISGSEWVNLDSRKTSIIETNPSALSSTVKTEVESIDLESGVPNEVLQKMNITSQPEKTVQSIMNNEKLRIFVSHGKSSAIIVGQLKELLAYGQMEPVISVERETTAIPVPDKVFDDMRTCDACIIHIDLEEVPYGNGEQKHWHLNENVLIEIGAAIALYEKRVVLLCKKNTKLPSNLQGLYRCEYDGDQLDYASTMKLLKTMQELREKMKT
jgi:predicted nucleotide-binding protein